MTKLGGTEFPDLRLDDAIQIITKISDKFKGKVETNEMNAFAQSIGHSSANNGAFFYKLGDLRKYGLIEPRNPIRITPLAQEILFPNNASEKQAAILKAIENVSFFRKLLELTNGNPPDSEFHITLQRAGVSKGDSIKQREAFEKVYNQIIPYVSNISNKTLQSQQEKGTNEFKRVENMSNNTFTQGNLSNFPISTLTSNLSETHYTADIEGIKIVIPKELDKLELAKLLITRWEIKQKEQIKKVTSAKDTTAE